MCAIKTKYGFGGNFKPIIKMLAIAKKFTLLEIGFKDELAQFIVQNFKLDMVNSPWVYNPLGKIMKIIKSNKKHPYFFHEPRSHIEYFVNQYEQEVDASPKWEFRILDKARLTLEGIKKYINWEVKR